MGGWVSFPAGRRGVLPGDSATGTCLQHPAPWVGVLLKGQCQRPRRQPHQASPIGEAGLCPSFCVYLGGALGEPPAGR